MERAISERSRGGVIRCSQSLFNQLAKDFPTKVAVSISFDGEEGGAIGAWGDDNVKMKLKGLPDWVMEVESGGAVQHVLISEDASPRRGAIELPPLALRRQDGDGGLVRKASAGSGPSAPPSSQRMWASAASTGRSSSMAASSSGGREPSARR